VRTYEAAIDHYKNKNYEQAINAAKALIKTHLSNANYHALLGGCYYRLKQYANASDSFGIAVSLDSNNPTLNSNQQTAKASLNKAKNIAQAKYYQEQKQYHPAIAAYFDSLNMNGCIELQLIKECLYDSTAWNSYTYTHTFYDSFKEPLNDALIHCKIGQCQNALKHYEEAMASFTLALNLTPSLEEAKTGKIKTLWLLSKQHQKAKEYKKKIDTYDQLSTLCTGIDLTTNLPQKKYDALNNLALQYQAKNQPAEEIKCLNQIISLYQNNAVYADEYADATKNKLTAQKKLALHFREEKQDEKAFSLYETIIKQNPDDDAAYQEQAGCCLAILKDYDEHNKLYLKALHSVQQWHLQHPTPPSKFHLSMALAYHYGKYGNYRAALSHLATAQKLSPNDKQAATWKKTLLVAQASQYLSNALYEKTIEICDTFIQLYSSGEQTLNIIKKQKTAQACLAKQYVENQQYDAAIAIYTTLRKSVSTSSGAPACNQGICYYKMEEFTQAIECFNDALNISTWASHFPDDTDALIILFWLGKSYDKQTDYEKAIYFFDRALKVSPDHLPAQNGKRAALWGLLDQYKKNDQYNEAIHACDSLIKISPPEEKAACIAQKGLIFLHHLAQEDDAIACFKLLKTKHPNFAITDLINEESTLEKLAWHHLKKKQNEQAAKHLNALIKLPQTEACSQEKTAIIATLNTLATQYYTDQKHQQAADLFGKLARLCPKQINPYCNQASCFMALEKFDNAIHIYTQALSRDAKYEPALEGLTSAKKRKQEKKLKTELKQHQKGKKYTLAINTLDKLITLFPKNPDYRCDKGKYLYKSKQRSKAILIWERILSDNSQHSTALKYMALATRSKKRKPTKGKTKKPHTPFNRLFYQKTSKARELTSLQKNNNV
jgi:tetratricopeptide (TPR) repeat protein